jgi:hypothetical protein
MAWTLKDFKTRPEKLTQKLQISVSGFTANNAPHNQLIDCGGDTYSIIDFGRNISGTAAVDPPMVPNELRVNATRGAGGNAYLLPWYTDSLCFAELGQDHDFFFTPTVNSCAIMISGGLCNPHVVHANTKSNRLDSVVLMDEVVAKYQQIYGEMAGKLGDWGMADRANLRVFQPGDYLSKGTVFGVRTAGRWAFYATAWGVAGATTKKLWPK